MNLNNCNLSTLLRLCESKSTPIMITDAHFRVLEYSSQIALLANTKELASLHQLYRSTVTHVMTTPDLFGMNALLLPFHLENQADKGYVIFFDTNKQPLPDTEQNLLFAELAHDIRSPLSSLISTVGLLNKALPKKISPQCKELVSIIGRTSDKIYEMTQNLLVLSQISMATKSDVSKQRIDLVAYLAQYCDDMNTVLEEKNIFIRFSSSPSHLTVSTEIAILERIITNLVTNAIRHAKPSTIGIDLLKTEGSYTITIWDDGKGMEKSSVEKFINDASHPAATKDGKNWGLGLSIVKTYTDFLNGEIVLSSSKEKGTSFSITFPLLSDSEKHEVVCCYNFLYSTTRLQFSFLFDENE